jgi:threonine/homoserine/homoserine lactone efflux protein
VVISSHWDDLREDAADKLAYQECYPFAPFEQDCVSFPLRPAGVSHDQDDSHQEETINQANPAVLVNTNYESFADVVPKKNPRSALGSSAEGGKPSIFAECTNDIRNASVHLKSFIEESKENIQEICDLVNTSSALVRQGIREVTDDVKKTFGCDVLKCLAPSFVMLLITAFYPPAFFVAMVTICGSSVGIGYFAYKRKAWSWKDKVSLGIGLAFLVYAGVKAWQRYEEHEEETARKEKRLYRPLISRIVDPPQQQCGEVVAATAITWGVSNLWSHVRTGGNNLVVTAIALSAGLGFLQTAGSLTQAAFFTACMPWCGGTILAYFAAESIAAAVTKKKSNLHVGMKGLMKMGSRAIFGRTQYGKVPVVEDDFDHAQFAADVADGDVAVPRTEKPTDIPNFDDLTEKERELIEVFGGSSTPVQEKGGKKANMGTNRQRKTRKGNEFKTKNARAKTASAKRKVVGNKGSFKIYSNAFYIARVDGSRGLDVMTGKQLKPYLDNEDLQQVEIVHRNNLPFAVRALEDRAELFNKQERYDLANTYLEFRDKVVKAINNPVFESGKFVGECTSGKRGIQYKKNFLKRQQESPSITPQCPRPHTYEVYDTLPHKDTKQVRLGYGFAVQHVFCIPFHFWASTNDNTVHVKVTNAKGEFWVTMKKTQGKHMLYKSNVGHSFIPLKGIENATKIKMSKFAWPEDPHLDDGQIYTMINNANNTVLSDVKIVRDGKSYAGHHVTTTKKGDCGSPIVMSFTNSASNLPQSHYLVGTHEWGNYVNGRNAFITFYGVKSFLARQGC